MPFEFIQIPANGQGNAKEELNKLLRGGRIASVRKEFVANGECGWSVSLQTVVRASRPDCRGGRRDASLNELARDAPATFARDASSSPPDSPIFTR